MNHLLSDATDVVGERVVIPKESAVSSVGEDCCDECKKIVIKDHADSPLDEERWSTDSFGFSMSGNTTPAFGVRAAINLGRQTTALTLRPFF